MKWLFVTTRFPWPLTHGTWLRTYHLGRVLCAAGDRVSLLSHEGSAQERAEYEAIGVEVLAGVPGEPPTRGAGRSFASPVPFDARLAERVAEHACEYDVVVLSHLTSLQYAAEARAARYVLSDIVDDPFLEWGRRFRHDRRQWLMNLRFRVGLLFYERAFVRHIDRAMFVGDEDARNFKRRHRRVCVDVVSNGVDARYLELPAPLGAQLADDMSLLFAGNMEHLPNADAATCLAREIVPRIRQRGSTIRAVIAGCNPPRHLTSSAAAGVEVTGFVHDLRTYFQRAAVVVLPLRMGTGIKNKLLEAWASGVAVVATPLACQSVDARHGHNVWIGRTVDELVDGVMTVLGDATLRRRLAENGRRSVCQSHQWVAIGERLRTRWTAESVESVR